MMRSWWQFDHEPLYGWSVSMVVHLCTFIASSLLLLPVGETRRDVLEVELGQTEAAAKLIELEPVTLSLNNLATQPSAPIFETVDPVRLAISQPATASTGAAAKPDESGAGSGERHGEGGSGAGHVSFFGTVATGHRFVYILDVSPSMNARRGQRIERAVLELLRSIDQLRADQEFYVLVFGWQTHHMFEGGRGIVPATLDNKQRLQRWLARIRIISGTDPREALEFGLNLKPDAIFFLSDGEFNKPPKRHSFSDAETEAEDVIRKSGSGETPIHTIAFEDRSSQPRMRRIAKLTGGQHIFIEPPAGEPAESQLNRRMFASYKHTVTAFTFTGEDARHVEVMLSK